MRANTAYLKKAVENAPLHLLSTSKLSDAWVSSTSRWFDKVWRLDGLTPGSKDSVRVINWEIVCDDGSGLMELRFEYLLGWLRRLVWSLLSAPAQGSRPLAAGTMSVLSGGIGHFARWMIQNSYSCPSQLDHVALVDYLESIIEAGTGDDRLDSEETGRSDAISHSFAFARVRVPLLIWRQRHVLAAAGVPKIPGPPWNGRTANDLTLEISTQAKGWIKPIPAEVAIPILNAASKFIGQRGEDILRVQFEYLKARDRGDAGHGNGPGSSNTARDVRSRKAVKAFRFSVLPGEATAWHCPIKPTQYSISDRLGVLPVVRSLVMSLRDAATIVIQAATGMRVSEICGLSAGTDPSTGLPWAVRIERSASGLNEVFILKSLLVKGEETPIDVDWVVGLRPLGSSEVPLPVAAILLMDRLFHPHRSMVGSSDLFVSLDAGLGLPENPGSVRRITGHQILFGQKRFVSENVDLSDLPDESANKIEDNDLVPWRESRGTIIRTHQFRKFFAAFTLGVDAGLLPALQMHFHHVSQAVTDYAYWGNNRLQVDPLSTVRSQQTNLLLFQLATGRTLLAGAMGEQLESHVAEIRARVAGKSASDAWKEVASYRAETDLRLWFAPHGMCLPMDRSEMRCHRDSQLSPWLRMQPHYAARESSTCIGCKCFVVDRRHSSYWEDKFTSNWISYRKAQAAGLHEGSFRVVKLRAAQARALLIKLGIDAESIEGRLEVELSAKKVDGQEG